MKEVVKVQAQVSMDALVQQMKSSFTAEVLHFPLPTKFRMPHDQSFRWNERPHKPPQHLQELDGAT